MDSVSEVGESGEGGEQCLIETDGSGRMVGGSSAAWLSLRSTAPIMSREVGENLRRGPTVEPSLPT